MKPGNRQERLVVALSASLPAITPKQRQWAIDTCFEKVGLYVKDLVWCSQCGKLHEKEPSMHEGDETVCPHCGARLKLKVNRARQTYEKCYFTILTTCKGYQVCRHFVIEKRMTKPSNNSSVDSAPAYTINEAVQNWISPYGRHTIIARSCNYCPKAYYEWWVFDKPMSIKRLTKEVDLNDRYKYSIFAEYVYPHRSILPILRRNGFTMRCKTIAPNEAMLLVLTDREAEMLIKNRQYELLAYKWKRCYKEFCMAYAHSVRVAIRNKYIVKDASMWYDYLDLLAYFHLDTHNAHYVCPTNLKREHDMLLKRKQRIERQRIAEQKRKEAEQWEAQYRKDKERFFDICFSDDKVVITVIQSVADMAEEGAKMHHCVFDMGYYKRKDSLILSARSVADGTRIETVEVSLKSFKVLQSHGLQNSYTPYHDVIINLVEKNINKIRQAV